MTQDLPRTRIALTVLVAAIFPIAWIQWLDRDGVWAPSDVNLAIRLVALSAVHWFLVARWLIGKPVEARRGVLARALWIGLLSPLSCCVLALVLGIAAVPLESSFGQPGATCALGLHGLAYIWIIPHLFFPFGVAMGGVAWAICLWRRPAAPDAPLGSLAA